MILSQDVLKVTPTKTSRRDRNIGVRDLRRFGVKHSLRGLRVKNYFVRTQSQGPEEAQRVPSLELLDHLQELAGRGLNMGDIVVEPADQYSVRLRSHQFYSPLVPYSILGDHLQNKIDQGWDPDQIVIEPVDLPFLYLYPDKEKRGRD